MKKIASVCLLLVIHLGVNAQRMSNDSLAGFDDVHFREHLSEIKDVSARKDYLQRVKRNFIKRKYNLTQSKTYASSAVATSTCGNFDFEDGNVAGWTMTGDFQVMSGSGVDPFGGFPVVCPGGNFSLRLNDNNTACTGPTPKINFDASASKTLNITASNSNIKVGFAACFLQFPHPQSAAANIKIRFYDQLDSLIPALTYTAMYASPPNSVIASSSTTYSNSALGGAQVCSTFTSYPVSYLPWQAKIFNLSSFVGQTVKIKLSADWCLYDYDWGYAYFDVCCDTMCPLIANSSTVVNNICLKGPISQLCSSMSGNINHLWSNSSGTISTATCIPCTNLGSYTLTSNPSSNPTYTFNEIFNVSTYPAVSFSLSTNVGCSNSSSGVPLFASPSGGTFSGAGVAGNSFNPWLVANGTYSITYTYADSIAGCQTSVTNTIMVTTCTGITEKNPDAGFTIAPNPFINEILVKGNDLPDNSEFVLFNALGQEILRKRVTDGKNIIETESVPAGLYIYSLFSQNKRVKQGKLVKE